MKYIEIADGLSVRVDEIEAVSVGEDTMTSIVKTHHNIYRSTFPYSVLIELLEGSDNAVREEKEKREVKMFNVLKEIGTYAG